MTSRDICNQEGARGPKKRGDKMRQSVRLIGHRDYNGVIDFFFTRQGITLMIFGCFRARSFSYRLLFKKFVYGKKVLYELGDISKKRYRFFESLLLMPFAAGLDAIMQIVPQYD